MAHDLIDSTEMYLRIVLELEEEGVPALRARVAERLHLSAPSVSEGVSRLEEQGLLRLTEDRTVVLTERGREWASSVMRKHRLAERLLADVIGLDPAHIHEEACRWEHVISDRVEQRIAELLGNPTTSPYGNPIPGSPVSGPAPVTLESVTDGTVTVHSLSEQIQGDADIVGRLFGAGIRAGATVTVDRPSAAEADGAPGGAPGGAADGAATGAGGGVAGGVELVLDGARVALSAEQSRLVFVLPVALPA